MEKNTLTFSLANFPKFKNCATADADIKTLFKKDTDFESEDNMVWHVDGAHVHRTKGYIYFYLYLPKYYDLGLPYVKLAKCPNKIKTVQVKAGMLIIEYE